MSLAVISAQHGRSLWALDRPPNEAALLGSPPVSAPAGVARTTEGWLVVTDAAGGAIAVDDGGVWSTYGSPGSGEGCFRRPLAVATTAAATFVADTGNDRVVRLVGLGPAGIAGGGWAAVGSSGRPAVGDAGAYLFSSPSGVAADGGTVLVADTGNGRLVAFPTDAFDTDPPSGWSVVDLPAGRNAIRPFGVARRAAGWAVSDVANACVHLLDDTLAVVGTVRTDRLRLGVPAYIAFDAADRLLIADPSANEVRLVSFGQRQRTVWRCRGSNPRYPAPLFERIGGVCAGHG